MRLLAVIHSILIVLAMGSCTRQPDHNDDAGLRFQARHGDYSVSTVLGSPPVKLKATPIEVTISPAGQVTTVEASVDMPGMPMHVAPVPLSPTAEGVYLGEIVFTMSGPWYVDIEVTVNGERWSVRHDGIRVP